MLANRVVVLQMHYDILSGGVFDHAVESLGSPRQVGLGIFRFWDIRSHARRTDGGSNFNPFLAECHRQITLRSVSGIWAVVAVDSNVHNSAVRFLHGGAKFFQVLSVRGVKVPIPRFNLTDTKFLPAVSSEVLQVHLLRGRSVARTQDEVSEWVGCNGDALA